MPHRMRLCFQQQANCTSPLLLQCLSYMIAHSQTREHAYVLTCKHTPTQIHPCCVCAQFALTSVLQEQDVSQCCLWSLLLCRVTCSQGEKMLVLFSHAHGWHAVRFSLTQIFIHKKKKICKQNLRFQRAVC